MFDTVIVIDWSARSSPSPVNPTRDAVYLCISRLDEGEARHPEYYRTRVSVMMRIRELLEVELTAGRRTLVGFDFNFGYPIGFAKKLTGTASGLAVWAWLSERIKDGTDNQNNRFEVAAQINAMFPGVGPFWGAPNSVSFDSLPHKGSARRGHGMSELRQTDIAAKTAQSAWKLYTAGSVGSQGLLGIYHLSRLKACLGNRAMVFPMEIGCNVFKFPVVLSEIYPSFENIDDVTLFRKKHPSALYGIRDARQVRQMCDKLGRLMNKKKNTAGLFDFESVPKNILTEEGWILTVPAHGKCYD